jgi:hypothetical protein
MERIYTQTTANYSHYPTIVPIVEGGTGSGSIQGVISAFNLISLDEIEVNVARKPSSGALSIADFSSSPTGYDVTLSGPTEISVGQVVTYTITNYDFTTDYGAISNLVSNDSTIQANPGVNGELVTYKAPGVYGDYGFILKGRAYPIKVVGAAGLQPTITQPAQNAVVGQKTIDFTATPFNDTTGTDTLARAEWELSTDATFAASSAQGVTPVIVTNSYSSAIELFTCNTLKTSSTYYLRVRYHGKNSKVSPWSTSVKFTTAAVFSALSVKWKITNPALNPNSNFGQCVRLFDHGTKIAIGAPGYNANGITNSGAVFIYDTITRALITTVYESPAPVKDNRFGESLDVTEDGVVMVVGVPGWKGARLSQPVSGKYQIFTLTAGAYKLYTYAGVASYGDITPLTAFNGNGVPTTGGGFKCNIEEGINIDNTGTIETYVEMNWPGKVVGSNGGVTLWLRLYRLYNVNLTIQPLAARDSACLIESRFETSLATNADVTSDSKFGHKSISIFVNNGEVHRFVGGLKSNITSATKHWQGSDKVQAVVGCGFVFITRWDGKHYDFNSNLVAPVGDCAIGDDFSYDMATALRGRILVVSAPGVGGNKGKVYVFEQRSYLYEHVLVAILESDNPTANERFGESVSINDLGTDIVVGSAQYTAGPLTKSGKSYKFSLTGDVNVNNGWKLVGSFTSPTALPGDALGYSVSDARGGDVIAVSAPNEEGANQVVDIGAVYLLV